MYKDIGLDLGEYQRERSVLLDDIEMRRTNKISPSVPYALDFPKLLCFAQGIYSACGKAYIALYVNEEKATTDGRVR